MDHRFLHFHAWQSWGSCAIHPGLCKSRSLKISTTLSSMPDSILMLSTLNDSFLQLNYSFITIDPSVIMQLTFPELGTRKEFWGFVFHCSAMLNTHSYIFPPWSLLKGDEHFTLCIFTWLLSFAPDVYLVQEISQAGGGILSISAYIPPPTELPFNFTNMVPMFFSGGQTFMNQTSSQHLAAIFSYLMTLFSCHWVELSGKFPI